NITPEMTSIQPGRVPWNMQTSSCSTPRRQVARGVLGTWRLGVWQRGGRVVSRGGWVKEVPVSCGFSGGYPILWRDFRLFGRPPEKRGETSRLSPALDLHKEIA